MHDWQQWVGLFGAGIIIGAYLLLQLGRLASERLAYSVANALGASLIVFSLLFAPNLSALIVEGFWAAISFFGIARYFYLRRSNK